MEPVAVEQCYTILFLILLLPVHQTFCCSLVNLYIICWESGAVNVDGGEDSLVS